MMLSLHIIATPSTETFSLVFDGSASGAEFRLAVSALVGAEVGRMVCGGRVVREEDSLNEQGKGWRLKGVNIHLLGIKNGAKIYITCKGTEKRVERSVPGNNSTKEDPLMGPLLKFLANNPELYQQMIMSNPHLQGLLESNPELRHALSDPSTLKSILSAASNPAAYNEMLRGQDRAISNLENMPEGFSHLKRVYSTMQEPMYDALSRKVPVPSSGSSEIRRELTSEPVPNPWVKSERVNNGNGNIGKIGSNSTFGNIASFGSNTSNSIPASRKRRFKESTSADELSKREADIIDPSTDPFLMSLLFPSSSKYAAQLEMMRELGFGEDEEESVEALEAVGGDVQAAIRWILNRRK